MTEPLFKGAAAALITPFCSKGVDLEKVRELTVRQLEGGTAALVVCGTTGEPATMSMQEREDVIRTVVEAAGNQIPVICGTGSNCTASVIETEHRFHDLGCSAQLVVTPYYNKTSQEGLYRHFMTIAENTNLPIILYNVPSRTGVDISPETLSRLCECDRFIGLKESSYDVPRIMEKMVAANGRITFYSGNDDMVYPLLALGAQGVISVVSNVYPRIMSSMVSRYLSGDAEGSRTLQLRAMPLVRALFNEVNPIPCKYAMERLHLCEGSLRLPLVEAGAETRSKIDAALRELHLI